MNVPNLITLIRILLIPVFVLMIIDKLFGWALITFAVAGITDGLDGFIARVTKQRTELGAILDPIADKLLLTAAFVTLTLIDIIPIWLTLIVITRDIIILLGFCVLTFISHRPKISPTFVSKVTTGFQILTILLALLAGYDAAFTKLSTLAILGATFFTILSGIHYIYVGARILNEKEG